MSLKWSCRLTGMDYRVLKGYDNYSKRKVNLYALALLIPVIIWFLNGFATTWSVLGAGFINSVIVGFICALLIYIVERLILMGNGNWIIGTNRLILAIAIALVGSFCMKCLIFKPDIDRELNARLMDSAAVIKARIAAESASARQALVVDMGQGQKKVDSFTNEAISETRGTGRPGGHGKRAKWFAHAADSVFQTQVVPVRQQLKNLEAMDEKKLAAYQEDQKKNSGVWTRLDVFLDMINKSGRHRLAFFLLFLLFLCLETVVLAVKFGLPESGYERDEALVGGI